jgi:Ni/Co efflux regulator RcnB
MKARSISHRLLQGAFLPVLAFGLMAGAAQGQDHHDDHHDDHSNRHDDHHDQQHGQDFRFHDQDRGHLAPHYQKDINRWQHNPHGRPNFVRGQRIPGNYRFQPVPRAYYTDVPPPPPGYQYGYYDGYVVAYDPTTRIIADVLDLVGAASNR